MITRETVLWAGDYQIKFIVYDDGAEWLVSINNHELELGATSDFCNGDWNKGLAEAVDSIAEMLTEEQIADLFYSLNRNVYIDKGYREHLQYRSPCGYCNFADYCIGSPAKCGE